MKIIFIFMASFGRVMLRGVTRQRPVSSKEQSLFIRENKENMTWLLLYNDGEKCK